MTRLRQGLLTAEDACRFDAELNKTDIVLSLDSERDSIDQLVDISEHSLNLSRGFIGLRTRGGAGVRVCQLLISTVKNDAWQLWNGGSEVGELWITHDAAIDYCDENHPDCLQAFAKPSLDYDPGGVFDGLKVGYAHCVVQCDDPARSKINGFLFTETCQYLNIKLFSQGLDYKSNSPAPYFLDMTNATNLVVGSAEHPVDPDRVSGKGIRIGARGGKSSAPASENIVIHAYRGLHVVLEGSALDAAEVVWYEKKAGNMKDAMMRMSNSGLRSLIESEDSIPHVYYCPAGAPTIGVGYVLSQSELSSSKIHLSSGQVIDFRNDRDITSEETMALLRDCLPKYEQVVNEAVNVPLDQDNFDALVHFAFNVGCGAFRKSTLVKRLNAMAYEDVPGEIMKWKYITVNGKKQVSSGLLNRREKECRMWSPEQSRDYAAMTQWIEKSAKDASGVDLEAAAKILGVGSSSDLKEQVSELGVLVKDLKRAGEAAKNTEVATEGFDQTLQRARELAESELKSRVDEIKADAVDSFRAEHTQKPMQSRTNRSVVGMIVSTGLRVIVGTTGLSAVFAEPAVAEIATGAIVLGLDAVTAGLGFAAMKFRNAATKFVG